MAVDTKWDTARLTALLQDIREQKSVIERNKSLLISINSEVETAWQGYAGRTFDQRMDIDVENLETFIGSMDSLIGDLEKVVKECYEECENDIDNSIKALNKII